MDLVQTVRKEGSRGGRTDFKWEDVKNDSQRENYLGHSLMAPVGRWQKNKDLNWYAKADADEEGKMTEAERIKEEKRKLKEAEEDAMLKTMGLPVPDRAANNANLTPLGEKVHEADVDKALKEKAEDGQDEDRERSRRHRSRKDGRDGDDDRRRRRRRSGSRDRHDRDRRRDRSRSRERRRHRDRDRDHDHERRRHRSRDRDHGRRRSRSRDRERDERHHRRGERYSEDGERPRSRSRDRRKQRSRSPYEDRRRRED